MKINNINKDTENDENLKSALLKILIDLNVELPENISTPKMETKEEQEEENIELEDLESKKKIKKGESRKS